MNKSFTTEAMEITKDRTDPKHEHSAQKARTATKGRIATAAAMVTDRTSGEKGTEQHKRSPKAGAAN